MTDRAEYLYSKYIANCVFNAFLSYTAITLNIVTIYAIRKTSSLSKPLKTLLLSLAVSDLGVGLIVQPLYIASLVTGLKQGTCTGNNPTFHTVSRFTANLFVFASFFGVVALSADRFLAIYLHLRDGRYLWGFQFGCSVGSFRWMRCGGHKKLLT